MIMIYNKSVVIRAFVVAAVCFVVYACANKAQGPTGGPKDETPPQVMRTTPQSGSLNFGKKLIQIDFDEIVTIEKPNENVIISPPQIKPPEVKAFGKRVTIEFSEELMDSTTYTINFGDAIVDLNEKNALKNYLFSFSTGNEIDTLKISGIVINAEDLNPMSGTIVGIYRETSDSVFTRKPFLRIGRTDENGRFSVNNVKKGSYKVFALADANRDYFFQPGEGLAMYDSLVTPDYRFEEMNDTIWKDSVQIDSIRTYIGTRFLPDDVMLRFFRESKKRQYFVKAERKEPFALSLYFNAPQDTLPRIKPLNFEWEGKHLVQHNATKDSITYWITDSLVWKTDTLEMAMTYMKSDSLMQLVPATDTLNLAMRKARTVQRPRSRNDATVAKAEPYKFSTNTGSTFEVYNPILLKFEAPISGMDVSKIRLSQKIDTIFKNIPIKIVQADSTQMLYSIRHKWIPENSYELSADSAAFTSIYNKVSLKYSAQFKIRSLDEYSSVKLYLSDFDSKAVLQVLDPKDNVLATKSASEKGTVFEYLKPGDYYVRMYIDENRNGKWDTGDLLTRRQPEEVFYYPKKMTLMANWEFEETWNHTQVPLLQQKPAELKKDASKKKD